MSFAYVPGTPVLTDVDLAVPAGSTCAIVGPTGAGKSTILALISRLQDPDRGTVLIDGVPAPEFELRSLRRRIAVVPQDVFLFTGTLLDNIRLFDDTIDEGDTLMVGDLTLDVWHTPGHAPAQLSFRLGDLLFSGDNIYRDGCVGNIDAHHGSDIPAFIESLQRIQQSDVAWLLPSHGPIFRKDNAHLQATIDRLERYSHRADFGTCAVDWPLLDEWDAELVNGFDPTRA